MVQFVITLDRRSLHDACCLCHGFLSSTDGPGICVAERLAPVCQACGKRYAPVLAALLELARVADRVGRIAGHTFMPPLKTLLDLERAAENYAESYALKKLDKSSARAESKSTAL